MHQAELWDSVAYVAIFCVAAAGLIGGQFLKVGGKGVASVKSGASGLPACWLWGRWLMVWGLAVCMGFAWAGWRGCERQVYASLDAQLQRRDIQITGQVDRLPQLQPGRWRFIFRIEHAKLDGQPIKLPRQIMLSWYFNGQSSVYPVPDIQVGQIWSFEVRLRAPHGYMNPYSFDNELWLWEQGIGAVRYVRTAQQAQLPALLSHERMWSMERLREAVRAQIRHQVADASVAGMLSALTLGDQQAITRSDWEIFRATGVAHLVSISGLHITMMAWMAYGLTGWFWRRSERLMLCLPAHMAALAGGLLCAAFYAWFAGWGIPAQRTIWMLATVVFLRFSGARWPWYSIWLLVAVVVVTADPWALLQPGFWLSFVAVGVLLAQSQIQRAKVAGARHQDQVVRFEPVLAALPWWQKIGHRFFQAFWDMLLVQWRISIVLAPLTLLLFHQVSVVGLLANLLAIPWVTFVMVPLALLGTLIHEFWYLAAWSGEVLSGFLQWCAQWPWALWEGAQPPLIVAVIAVAGAVIFVLPLLQWRYRIWGVLPLIAVFLWQPAHPDHSQFEVRVFDVGQGSAILVQTASHALLYDTGPKYSRDLDAGAFIVVPTLRALGISPDRIVVSHADQDHAGGIASVLAAYPQADVMWSAPQTVLTQFSVPAVLPCTAGVSWQWDGVLFTVIHPENSNAAPVGSSNAQSCVLRISTQNGLQNRAALLTGDIEALQEQALVERYGTCMDDGICLLRADLLLMPHHGSKSSSSPAFLNAVRPRWGVAQAGYLNRFGHPDHEVVSRYGQSHIQVANTANCGAALWRSMEPDVVQCERSQRRRYWHWTEGLPANRAQYSHSSQ